MPKRRAKSPCPEGLVKPTRIRHCAQAWLNHFFPASYPDVSLALKICAQKAGREKRASPLIFLLPMVPCASLPITRVSLAFRTRLYEKNEAPEKIHMLVKIDELIALRYFSGHHHLKKLWKERVLATLRKGKFQEKAAKRDSTRQHVKDNLSDEKTRNVAYFRLAKINALLKSKLKKPITKHHRSNSSIEKKYPIQFQQFVAKRPSYGPLIQVPQKLRLPLAGKPSTDFDEEATEEVGSTRDTIQDEASFQESRKSENDPDSDGVKESNNSAALAPHIGVTKTHYHDADEGDMMLVHDEGQVADEKGSPLEDQIENKQSQEETTTSKDKEDDEDDDDEEEDQEDDEDKKTGDQETDDTVEQRPQSLKKMKQGPTEMSDQKMQNSEIKQDQLNAVRAERERQLQRLQKFYIAQEKQRILRRLWLNYVNTIDQNTGAQPFRQHVSPLAWSYPTGLSNAFLLLVPTDPGYQPANELRPIEDTDNKQGYSVSVDGLNGVFSKEPGLVVKFNSPSSEVTVAKRSSEVTVVNK